MLRALLVNPNVYRALFRRPGEPLGISYIAGFLRENGVETDLLDLNYNSSSITLTSHLSKGYDLVGISLYCNGYAEAIGLTSHVKRHLPQAMVVVGGHQATAIHEHIIQTCQDVDMVVRGEGERTTLELIRYLQGERSLDSIAGITFRSEDGSVVVTPPRPLLTADELSTLPPPVRDILRIALSSGPQNAVWRHFLRDPIATISASRGCPHHCTFCSVASFYAQSPGPAWRTRSVDSVIHEVRQVYESFGVKRFWFVDDSFLVNACRARELAQALVDEARGFRFGFAARADDIVKHSALVPELRRMGCEAIEIGLESGAQSALDRYQKGTTVTQNLEAIAIVRRSGLRIIPDIIMFDPWTTMEELRENVAFLRQTGLWGWLQPDILAYTFCACPGTPMFARMLGEGQAIVADPTGLEWDFADPGVGRVHAAITQFLENNSARIDTLLGILGDVQRFLADISSAVAISGGDAHQRLTFEFAIESTAMPRIPYALFADLVEQPQAAEAALEKAGHALDGREQAILKLRDAARAYARHIGRQSPRGCF